MRRLFPVTFAAIVLLAALSACRPANPPASSGSSASVADTTSAVSTTTGSTSAAAETGVPTGAADSTAAGAAGSTSTAPSAGTRPTDPPSGGTTAGSEGKLSVSASVSRPRPDADEVRPDGYTADKLNPEIAAAGGATAAAQAMREAVTGAADTLEVSGTSYYVSPAGSDENNGTSPEEPLASIAAAQAMAQEGDAVLLERGAVFRLPSGITLANGVTYGAYGTGAKPEIWGSPENYAQASMWSPYTIKNVWKMDFSRSDVGIIVFNHGEAVGEMQYYVRNLTENGDYFFDDVQRVLYLYCDKGNPGAAYEDIEIGSRTILFRLRDGAHDVTIDNICLKYTGTFGIRGSTGCRNITITNCEIGWVGGSLFEDGSNRYGNGIELTGGCQDILIENCWIYQVYDAGFTFQITMGADEDPAYSTFKNITFRNNLVEYCSWAFEWWPSSDSCTIENIAVTDNLLRFSGYGWARDTRSPAHIRGPWSVTSFQPVNFRVTGNTFDCSNGPIYGWRWATETQPGHVVEGNRYYQMQPPLSQGGCVVFDLGKDGGAPSYASSQEELEAAVRAVDPNPKEIKWLS